MSSNFIQSGNQPNPENLVESTEDVELDTDEEMQAIWGGVIGNLNIKVDYEVGSGIDGPRFEINPGNISQFQPPND